MTENLEIKSLDPMVIVWHKMWLIKISDVDSEFSSWLSGQTLPYVEESDEPSNWAFYSDYSRWKQGLPVID